MTDVNIAVQMLQDGFNDQFDTAILISADSDFTTPVRVLREKFQNKVIIAVFPPGRHSYELQKSAHSAFILGEANLRKSQFPDQVKRADGFILRRPDTWR